MLKMDGCWRLVYSTISIMGSKRTKLGLRDFISLDEFFQIINVAKVQRTFEKIHVSHLFFLGLFIVLIKVVLGGSKMESKAVNVIKFSAKGLSLLNGQLSIEASFKIASTSVKSFPTFLLTYYYYYFLFFLIKTLKLWVILK